jgi:hypothetical protein
MTALTDRVAGGVAILEEAPAHLQRALAFSERREVYAHAAAPVRRP